MNINNLKEHADMYNTALAVAILVSNAGGNDVRAEADENFDDSPFIEIWDEKLLSGKSVAYVGIDNGKVVITNNLTNEVNVTFDDLAKHLSYGISLDVA
jgi:hypothetical protein